MINFKQILQDCIDYDKIQRPLSEILNNFHIMKVPFGSNVSDGKWIDGYNSIFDKTFHYTFFYLSGNFYIVILYNDGWVKFNSIKEEDIDKINNPSVEDVRIFTQFNRVKANNISDVFSSVIYVIMEGTSYFPELTQIYFKGADSKLQKVYMKIIENGQLLHFVKKYGFKFSKIDQDDNIIFDKLR